MATKTLKISIALAALVTAAYWYWSPLLAMRQMQSAAKAGDANDFSDHVDYPKLRESFKGQFSAMFAERMAAQSTSDNDLAKAGAALAMMLGTAMVNQFVDAMVRPEVVMRAMQEGRLMPKKGADGGSATPTESSPPAQQKVEWSAERKGVDMYIAYAHRPGEPQDKRIGLVLERSGFATWKLTEIRLPSLQ